MNKIDSSACYSFVDMEGKPKYTLSRNERLKGTKAVQQVFAGGESFTCYPLRVLYIRDAESRTQVLFSVPKKRFRHAVDRNRLKRLMREAYRLNKHVLPQKTEGLHVAFVAITDVLPSFDLVQKKMREALLLLAEKQ